MAAEGLNIEIRIEQQSLRKFEKALRDIPNGLPRVMSRAINRTLNSARVKLAKFIKAEIPKLKQGDIKSRTRIRKSTYKRLAGLISLSDRKFTLARFAYKQTSRGVPFMIRRSEGRLIARRAFYIEGREPPFIRAVEGTGENVRKIDWRTGLIEGEGQKLVARVPLAVIVGPSLAELYIETPNIKSQLEKFCNIAITKNMNDYLKLELKKHSR